MLTSPCTPTTDYSGCPQGWTSQGDKKCLAPSTYAGSCGTSANFSGSTYDAKGKAAWAEQCDAPFPATCCTGQYRNSNGDCVDHCGPGHYVESDGTCRALSAAPCTAGMYRNSNGDCVDHCGPGHYVESDGTCKPCAVGSRIGKDGSCTVEPKAKCPPGAKFVNGKCAKPCGDFPEFALQQSPFGPNDYVGCVNTNKVGTCDVKTQSLEFPHDGFGRCVTRLKCGEGTTKNTNFECTPTFSKVTCGEGTQEIDRVCYPKAVAQQMLKTRKCEAQFKSDYCIWKQPAVPMVSTDMTSTFHPASFYDSIRDCTGEGCTKNCASLNFNGAHLTTTKAICEAMNECVKKDISGDSYVWTDATQKCTFEQAAQSAGHELCMKQQKNGAPKSVNSTSCTLDCGSGPQRAATC